MKWNKRKATASYKDKKLSDSSFLLNMSFDVRFKLCTFHFDTMCTSSRDKIFNEIPIKTSATNFNMQPVHVAQRPSLKASNISLSIR